MIGQKQIISCLVIVIFLAIFNFHRSIIKRDKEIRANRAAAALKLGPNSLISQRSDDVNLEVEFRRYFNEDKMLEFPDKCLDIHALVFRPNYDKINRFDEEGGFVQCTSSASSANRNFVKARGGSDRSLSNSCDCVPLETGTGNDINNNNNNNRKMGKRMEKSLHESTGLVYIFVFILLVLLGKAAFDISKQLKEQRVKAENENELRRYSLHDYSLMKHKRKGSKAMETLMKKSVITQRSLDSGTKAVQQSELGRMICALPREYNNGSGLITEPGTPQKAGNLLAERPAPLLRRCSVPVFANKPAAPYGIARRPSMDSFSEDDSSPDIRRRVRMIQRH